MKSLLNCYKNCFENLLDLLEINEKPIFFFNTKREDDNKPKNQYKEFQKCQGFGIMHDDKTH